MPVTWRKFLLLLGRGRTAQSVFAWLSRAVDLFPLTPLGVVLAIGAYTALKLFAYAELDLVWLVTGYVALGLTAVSVLCTLGAALYLWLRVRARRRMPRESLKLETRRLSQTGFELPSLRFLPFVQVQWQCVSPETTALEQRSVRGDLREYAALRERGHHTQLVRRIWVQDPFGLARIAFRARDERELWVLPELGGLSQLPSLHAPAGGADLPHPMGLEDGDRLELTRYTPGDPARFIHWKAFARSRKLLVRRPERAISVVRRCAAFYIAGPDDDATAAVARLAIERNLLGREWSFGTDLLVSGTSRVDEALSALLSSVKARASHGAGLAGFLARADTRGPASVIVFAPPEPAPWLDAVARVAARRPVQVVMAVDGVAEAVPPSRWLQLFRVPSVQSGARFEALEEVLLTLGRSRVPVTLLDRSTGAVLGDLRRAAMQHSVRKSRQSGLRAPNPPNPQRTIA